MSRWSIYLETSWLICTSRIWKLYESQTLSKDVVIFLKISFVFRRYSYFFAIANRLPGFSISILANVIDFFNVNTFFKCKLNINVRINNHSLYLCSMLLETSLLLSHLFRNVDFESNLIEFQIKTNIKISFLLMDFRFALDSWNIDLWDIDLLDTDLDLLVSHG